MSTVSFAARRSFIKSIREGGGWLSRLEQSRLRGSPYPTHVAEAVKAILRSAVTLPSITGAHPEPFIQDAYPRYPRPFHAVMGREMETYAMSVYFERDMRRLRYRQVDSDSFIFEPPSWRPHFG